MTAPPCPRPEPAPAAGWHGWPWPAIAVALAALVACIPIWLPRYVATMDGPQHLLAAHMALHFDDAAAGFARHFAANPRHLTPILGDLVLRGLLGLGLSPPVAQQVFLTLWVGALAGATAWAASWRRRASALLGGASLLMVPGLVVGMGFFEFLLSLPLAIAALGVVLRGPELSRGRLALLAALALASALAHPFTIVALLPALAAAAWATGAPLWRVGLGLLPALGVGAYAFFAHVGTPPPVPQPTVWAPLGTSLATLAFDAFDGVAPTGAAGLVGMAAVLAAALLPAWRAGGRTSRVLLGAALLYAILTVATPSTAFNWALLHHRFVPLVWLVALAAVGGVDARPRLAPLGLAIGALALVTQTVIAAGVSRRIDANLREYVAAAGAVPPGARLLPLDFAPRGESQHRQIRPYLHAWAYVLMERGGMTPYVFASLPAHAFHFRARPRSPVEFIDQDYSCARRGLADATRPCHAYRHRRLEIYASRARAFDAVLTWQAPPELRPVLEGAGFELQYQTAHAAVYRRPGAG